LGCIKEELDELKRTNKSIEKELQKERKLMKNRIKILLLGCGEAGKSTFIKQMVIIHAEQGKAAWTDDQLTRFRKEILRNIIQCLQILLQEQTGELPIGFANNARKLEELEADDEKDQSKLYQHRVFIKEIWMDDVIQEVYRRRNEFQLPDCCQYFLNNIDRVSSPDFVPTNQDILQIRVMTTGVVEHSFPMNKDKEVIMIDVGGQRSERKKWIHFFEDVLLLMFLTAASEYDQVLMEDHSENRMKESVNLFRVLVSEPWFRNSSVALFLNKKDLLEEKIRHSPLEDHFTNFRDFKGYRPKDADSAMEFIKDMFLNMKKPDNTYVLDTTNRSVFVHKTCATDTENIKKVFEDIKTSVLEGALREMF